MSYPVNPKIERVNLKALQVAPTGNKQDRYYPGDTNIRVLARAASFRKKK